MHDSFPTLFASVDVVEKVITDFQDAWKRGEPSKLTTFFAQLEGETPQVRESVQLLLILQDQSLRWQMWRRQRESSAETNGKPDTLTEHTDRAPLLEDYVRYCSVAGGIETLPPEMVTHEFRLRQECGDSPSIGEYTRRFPHLSQSLSTLLAEPLTVAEFSQATLADETPTVIDPTQTPPLTPRQIMEGTQPMSAAAKPARRQESVSGKANFGQYEFLNEIARGAMGVVYRARHVTIDKIVALKMILAGDFASQLQIDQFLREAQNAGRLEHDNIVRIYDAGNIQGQYYIAMAYIEGQSLSDLVREKPLSAQRSAEIVELVARALHFAHIQPEPVYHRDIKPANILMDHSGRPYVTDFGIAKRVERDSGSEDGQDDIAGTPSYMPPEQTFGRDIGPWSDVYSTGALLYHLLTGKPPFLADSLMETIRQVRSAEPVPPSDLNPKVDPDLEAVCMKCLEKDRTKRYSSAEHLADDLRRFLNHEPTQARPISQLGRFTKWCYRSPVVAGLAMTSALLLITVAIGTTVALFREKESKEREVIARQDAEQAKEEAIKARDIARRDRDAKQEALRREEAANELKEKAKQEAIAARDDAIKAKLDEEKAKDKAVMAQKEETLQRLKAEKAEHEADQARLQAEANLQKAIQTVNLILTRSAESRLKDVPGMEEFRKRVAQDALEQLEPILKANSNQKEAMEARAKVLVVQAKLFDLTGQSDRAEGVFDEAIKEYRRLGKTGTEKTKHTLELMAAYRQWGDSLTDRAKVDYSASERPLGSDAELLLKLALEKYGAALEIVGNEPEATEISMDIELARMHQSRSITFILLKQSEAAVESLTKAIQSLKRVISQPSDWQLDSERQLGSCWRSLAMQDSLLTPEPNQKKLEAWLDYIDQAKTIHQRLYQDNRELADIRFDYAMTCYSRARVLTGLAQSLRDDSRYAQAAQELAVASGLFSELAADFRRTPVYEYHRIGTIQLQAAILAVQKKIVAAALKFGEADVAIRMFNERFPKAPQENLRLRICYSALELCIKMLPSTDLPTKKNTVIWVIKGLQELRQAADPNTAQEARLLALVAEYFEALVLTEDRREPEAWISKLKLLDSTLKDYCSHFLGGDCDGLRLTLCLEARNVARDYLGKNDRITSGNIVDWSKKVLDELRISKNEAVSINAIDILAAAEQLPKIKP